MAAPGKDLGLCPECDTKLAVVNDTLFCHQCRKVVDGGVETVSLAGNWTDSQRIQAMVEKIAEGTKLIYHAGQVYHVMNGELLPLTQTRAGIEQLRRLVNVAEGALIRMPTRDEAAEVMAAIWEQPHLFPAVDIVVPRPVLYLNHADEPVVTEPGLNGRIYQSGPTIKPANTGAWTEFLDMTPFASDVDRRTYVAWCLAALFPLEYYLSPLFVVHADGQEAGKTWLVQALGVALGYKKAEEMDLTTSAKKFRRATVAAMRQGRLLLWDNVTGSSFGFVENNWLSAALTSRYMTCGALYRVGTEQLQNRHLWAMSMNVGRLCEDLASRAISCKLSYDPDHAGVVKRGQLELGEDHWLEPENNVPVLQEMLYAAQEAFQGDRTIEGTIPRPQRWHRLCAKLGYPTAICGAEVREAGDLDVEWLLRALGKEGKSATQLVEMAREGGRTDALARAAQRGAAQVGLILTRAKQCGVPILAHRTKSGRLWCCIANG